MSDRNKRNFLHLNGKGRKPRALKKVKTYHTKREFELNLEHDISINGRPVKIWLCYFQEDGREIYEYSILEPGGEEIFKETGNRKIRRTK